MQTSLGMVHTNRSHLYQLTRHLMLSLGLCLCFSISTAAAAAQANAPEFVLAQNKQSLTQVTIAPNASDRVQHAASELATFLGRMADTKFEVQQGDGSKGIVVGLASDFPALPAAVSPTFDAKDPRQQEHYLLQTTSNGVYLIGASETGVEDAVWDFLYRLGFRQFFPGKNWEIVPQLARIAVSMKVQEKPDYDQRIMVANGGSFQGKQWLETWQHRNRASANDSEMHDRFFWSFYLRNKSIFQEKPELMALVQGNRTSRKYCLSNLELRQLMIDFAIDTLRKDPKQRVLALSPLSPRGGWDWCECAQCAAVGGPADNLIAMANLAAEHPLVIERNATIYITASDAMLLPPRSVNLHPRIAVTLELPTLLTLDYENQQYWKTQVQQQLDGWRARGAKNLGVEVIVGGPTGMTDPMLQSLSVTLPFLHEHGVNRIELDMGEYWGSIGLANYVTSQLLWDGTQAKHIDALVDDFFNKSFGPAASTMRQYFQLLGCMSDHRPVSLSQVFSDERISSMYRLLAQALAQTTSAEIEARICDMAAHTRALDLQALTLQANKQTLSQHSDALMQFVYQTKDRGMSPAYEMFASPQWYGVKPRANSNVKTPEDKNPWKVNPSLSDQQLKNIVKNAIARHEQKGKDQ